MQKPPAFCTLFTVWASPAVVLGAQQENCLVSKPERCTITIQSQTYPLNTVELQIYIC